MSRMSDDGRVSRRALLLGGGAALVAAAGTAYVAEHDNPRIRRLLGGCGTTPPLPSVHTAYDVTTGSIDSGAMKATMPYTVATPHDNRPPGVGGFRLPTPLVVVLPGRNGGADDLTKGVGVARWASRARLKLAFVQPGNTDSCYWHRRADGRDPIRFLTDELIPAVTASLSVVSSSATAVAVLGWSMGGFGALACARSRPDLFKAAAAMSAAVFPSYANARGVGSYTFDSAADWQRYGIWADRDKGFDVPVRIDCGDSDPFLPQDRELLKVRNVVGGIEKGCHDTGFWRRQMPTALQFLAANLG